LFVHEEAAARARKVGDGAREVREFRFAVQQAEGARTEDSRAEEVAAMLAALSDRVAGRVGS